MKGLTRRTANHIFAPCLALALVAGCGRPAPPAPEGAPPGPIAAARTVAPPAPHAPPAQAPHTRVVVDRYARVALDPTAGSWRPVLYTPAENAVPAPPAGDAAAADRRRAAELRAAPAAEWERTAEWWAAGAVRRWNEIARELTQAHRLSSGPSARRFALLAVAQYDAAVAARRFAERFALETSDTDRLSAAGRGAIERYGYPSQEAAIAEASVRVLLEFFAADERFLIQNALAHGQSRIWMGAALPSDIDAGHVIGKAAGAAAIRWARADGADAAGQGRVDEQPGKWYSRDQTLPGFGRIKPWTMRSGDQFRAPPPPALESPEFATALAEIRRYSDELSAEQLAIAQYWNLGVGGVSVPGMWDQIALDLASEAGYSETRTARTLALTNMAMMDACIASWDTKFHYLVPRPSMRDSAIKLPLGLPAHPAYTSGHSAFSGAAEGILSAIFPGAADELHRLAEEASASRWYGGLHYRFDGDEGLKQGRSVAAWVLQERAMNDGAPGAADLHAAAR